MPFVYMMFSVLIWSLFPLVSTLAIQQLSIVDYILWTFVVAFIVTALGFAAVPRQQKTHLPKISKIEAKTFLKIFAAGLSTFLTFACLLKSFSFMSRASAVILAEVWLIIVVYMSPLLLKKGWEKISRRDLLFSRWRLPVFLS